MKVAAQDVHDAQQLSERVHAELNRQREISDEQDKIQREMARKMVANNPPAIHEIMDMLEEHTGVDRDIIEGWLIMTTVTDDHSRLQTHYAGCWKSREHHECAITEIEALRHDIDRHLDICTKQATEIERLREALERSADTFKDFGTFMRMTDRPVLVGICAIAEGDARAVLSGRASEPEQRIIGIDCTQPSDEQQCADCGEQGHSHCTPVKEIDSP